ncbi:MAG: T9SS type A sorting domain-containing protein, partial [Salinivirgaceae bacterium]|nr:T9SS type A sorting domain-containing protein [Salinivirgaceae bacterium]
WMSSPKIAAGSDNKLYVTYDYDTNNEEHTMVHMQIYDGTSWSQPLIVSEGMSGSYYSRLVMDEIGKLHVFWFNYSAFKFQYRSFFNGEFSAISQPFNLAGMFFFLKGVVDGNGVIHCIGDYMAPSTSHAQFIYFKQTADQWSDYSIINDKKSATCDLALNDLGEPRVVWWRSDSGSFSTYYLSLINNLWSEPVQIAEYTHQQAICVEQNGNEHIVLREKKVDGYRQVHYSHNEGVWKNQVLAETIFSSWANKLVISDTIMYLIYSIPIATDVYNTKLVVQSLPVKAISSIEHSGSNGFNCTVYPNPAKQQILVNLKVTLLQPAIVFLYNSYGQMVLQNRIESGINQYVLQLEDQTSGIYLLRIESGIHKTTKKIMIMK